MATALERLTEAYPSRAASSLEQTADLVGHDYNVRIPWLRISTRLSDEPAPPGFARGSPCTPWSSLAR